MPNERSLVSVVIPTHNHGHYVGDAVRSVLAQDYRHFEIIVVDDGSTDDTKARLHRFGSSVRYVWQENRGLSAARNTGIRLAVGTYVGVLDADDMYEPEFMSALVPILDHDPEAAAVYCGYRFVDERNAPLPQVEARLVASERLYQALIDGNFLVPESILVRRRCYEAVGPFDESLRALEDVDMWLRIAGRYRVLGTRRVLTRHRVLPTSMSTDPERQRINRLRVMRKQVGAEATDPREMTDAQRRAYGRAHLVATVEHLQSGRDVRAGELLRRMAAVCPELLLEFETFYELACGSQPKGYRGDFASLDVPRNAAVLEQLLDSVLADVGESDQLRGQKKRIRARAGVAVGLLHYGKRELPQARKVLLRALASDPACAFDARFAGTFARSLLPASLINWHDRRRPRPTPDAYQATAEAVR